MKLNSDTPSHNLVYTGHISAGTPRSISVNLMKRLVERLISHVNWLCTHTVNEVEKIMTIIGRYSKSWETRYLTKEISRAREQNLRRFSEKGSTSDVVILLRLFPINVLSWDLLYSHGCSNC